jgi:hypothetical protein
MLPKGDYFVISNTYRISYRVSAPHAFEAVPRPSFDIGLVDLFLRTAPQT